MDTLLLEAVLKTTIFISKVVKLKTSTKHTLLMLHVNILKKLANSQVVTMLHLHTMVHQMLIE